MKRKLRKNELKKKYCINNNIPKPKIGIALHPKRREIARLLSLVQKNSEAPKLKKEFLSRLHRPINKVSFQKKLKE